MVVHLARFVDYIDSSVLADSGLLELKEIELNAEADYGRFLTECGFLKARQYSLMLRLQDL